MATNGTTIETGLDPSSSQRFDAIAANYKGSEVHRTSPTVDRLREWLPNVESVCDVASGAGHTGLAFADTAARIVAVDPAPNMLAQVRELASERGVAVEGVSAYAEAIPLPSASFDLVTCRLAAHHFADVDLAVSEMARLAKPGGHVAVIDMEGDDDPDLDSLNHDIEVLHDPTHVRSYTAARWRQMFAAAGVGRHAVRGPAAGNPGRHDRRSVVRHRPLRRRGNGGDPRAFGRGTRGMVVRPRHHSGCGRRVPPAHPDAAHRRTQAGRGMTG